MVVGAFGKARDCVILVIMFGRSRRWKIEQQKKS